MNKNKIIMKINNKKNTRVIISDSKNTKIGFWDNVCATCQGCSFGFKALPKESHGI